MKLMKTLLFVHVDIFFVIKNSFVVKMIVLIYLVKYKTKVYFYYIYNKF